MTARELAAILESREFRDDLSEMSLYLKSIMQERPIVYSLAKHLSRLGKSFDLEDQKSDLFIDEKRVEFKFNFNRVEERLSKELTACAGDLAAMYHAARSSEVSTNFDAMPKIYKDFCDKKPHLFVWIICSRDFLADAIPIHERSRICMFKQTCKYNSKRPYNCDGKSLVYIDRFLELLSKIRPFEITRLDVQTNNLLFASTYHFRIGEFETQQA